MSYQLIAVCILALIAFEFLLASFAGKFIRFGMGDMNDPMDMKDGLKLRRITIAPKRTRPRS